MVKKPIKKAKARIPVAKKPGKRVDKKLSLTRKTLPLLRGHKIIVFLSLLVLLFPTSFVYEKYLDWDNAQMIKGLARDFPELVSQIEAETGLDLEIKRDCMTTSEKSGSGVRTCELYVGYTGLTDAESKILDITKGSSKFIIAKNSSGQSYSLSYRNEDTCEFWSASKDKFYVRCLVGVRSVNVDLVANEFNK